MRALLQLSEPMRLRYLIAMLAIATLMVAGCSMPKMPKLSMPKFKMPRVHKVTVQQGNVITQEMIDSLKPGMTRAQVAYIMGEPIVRNTFDQDRWDYIYTIDVPGVYGDEKRMSLHFDDDKLTYFTGDYVPDSEKPEEPGEADKPEDNATADG